MRRGALEGGQRTRQNEGPAYIPGMSEYPIKNLITHHGNFLDPNSETGDCCGCWNLYLGNDGRHYARCNECDVVHNAPLPPGTEQYLPQAM